MSDLVFLNDSLVAVNEAAISVFDAGLQHGVGLSEVMRSYGGKVFRLNDHLERLLGSAKCLGLGVTQEPEDLVRGVEKVLAGNELTDAVVRLSVTRGNMREFTEEKAPSSTVIITAEPFPVNAECPSSYGVLALVSPYKVSPFDPLVGHQMLNDFGRLFSLQQGREHQASEVLWFTIGNRLSGGAMSNVFLVKDGVVMTPALNAPAFNGVTRRVVLGLAKDEQLEAVEKELIIGDVLGADEVFLTSSLLELVPVTRIEKHVVGGDEPGPIYRQLHKRYRELSTACG